MIRDNNEFLNLDRKIASLFASSASFLNTFTFNGIKFGFVFQSNFYAHIREKKSNISFKNRLSNKFRVLGIDHFIKLLIGVKIFSKPKSKHKKVMIFCEFFVPHMLDDLVKIAKNISENDVLVLTNDKRVKQYLNNYTKIDVYKIDLFYLNFKGSFNFINYMKVGLEKVKDEIKAADKEFNINFKSVFIINSYINYLYSKIFEEFIKKNQPASLLVGSDGFPLSRVIIDICYKYNIPSYTLQHGLIDTLNGYYPLYASKAFVWSKVEKKLFINLGVNENRLIVSSSPKFEQDKSIDGITTKENTILVVLSNVLVREIQNDLEKIQILAENLPEYQVFIRPHPYYEQTTVSIYNSMPYPKVSNLSLTNTKSPIKKEIIRNEIIVLNDVSTVYFEAQSLQKKVLIWENNEEDVANNNKLDLYEIEKYKIEDIISIIRLGKESFIHNESFFLIKPSKVIASYLKNDL